MHIVLLEPEIPMNTGNIGRTCVATGSGLHLIKPLGFSLDEKAIRRSGLDYWQDLQLHVYEDFEEFSQKNKGGRFFMATTKSKRLYTDMAYQMDDYIVFGKESAGIPEELLLQYKETAIRVPMVAAYRSLNLANSVAVVLYEALRQNHFPGLLVEGNLHRHEWDAPL